MNRKIRKEIMMARLKKYAKLVKVNKLEVLINSLIIWVLMHIPMTLKIQTLKCLKRLYFKEKYFKAKKENLMN